MRRNKYDDTSKGDLFDIIIWILLIVCGLLLLDAFLKDDIKYKNKENGVKYISFIQEGDIVVDDRTYIAYIKESDSITPYYSGNGKLQKYIDGKFIEVGD
jgi:hypothetical protein